MNTLETRQYEMLLRVRDFGTTHRDRFPDPGVAREAFAALAVAIEGLAAADVAGRSASAAARSDRKTAAGKVLGDLLLKAGQTARVLRARGHSMPAFEVPRTNHAMLSAARQFARDATPVEAAFVAHGIAPGSITEAATAFETAMRDRGMSRAELLAARTRIRELFATALDQVRTLDVVIRNELASDKAIHAVWQRARRVDARRPRSASLTDTPAPAADPGEEAA